MKYVKTFENFTGQNPEKITVKLTDKFIKEENLYKFNEVVEMQPEISYNLGNTHATATGRPSTFIFATYFPDINEIQCFKIEAQSSSAFLRFAKEATLNHVQKKRLIDSAKEGDYRYIPDFYSKFEKGFQPGETDDRGYFEITKVEI
jgi:hypothetical protein